METFQSSGPRRGWAGILSQLPSWSCSSTLRRKDRTVAAALGSDQWLMDLRHGNVLPLLAPCVLMARRLAAARITLQPGVEETLAWVQGTRRAYSVKSAYQ